MRTFYNGGYKTSPPAGIRQGEIVSDRPKELAEPVVDSQKESVAGGFVDGLLGEFSKLPTAGKIVVGLLLIRILFK